MDTTILILVYFQYKSTTIFTLASMLMCICGHAIWACPGILRLSNCQSTLPLKLLAWFHVNFMSACCGQYIQKIFELWKKVSFSNFLCNFFISPNMEPRGGKNVKKPLLLLESLTLYYLFYQLKFCDRLLIVVPIKCYFRNLEIFCLTKVINCKFIF